MQSFYLDHIDNLVENRGTRVHYAGYLTNWHPTDSLTLMGNHPELGILWGISNGKWEADIDFSIRFLDSEKEKQNILDIINKEIRVCKRCQCIFRSKKDYYLCADCGKIIESGGI